MSGARERGQPIELRAYHCKVSAQLRDLTLQPQQLDPVIVALPDQQRDQRRSVGAKNSAAIDQRHLATPRAPRPQFVPLPRNGSRKSDGKSSVSSSCSRAKRTFFWASFRRSTSSASAAARAFRAASSSAWLASFSDSRSR